MLLAEASGDHPVNAGNVPGSAKLSGESARQRGEQQGVCVLEPRMWETPRAPLAWSQVHLRSRQSRVSPLPPRLLRIRAQPKTSPKSRQEQRAVPRGP